MSIPEETIENINYDETPDTQFAENQYIDNDEDDPQVPSSEEKRLLLKKTKIVKQTWSIQEIYQKLNLVVWFLLQIISVMRSGKQTKNSIYRILIYGNYRSTYLCSGNPW